MFVFICAGCPHVDDCVNGKEACINPDPEKKEEE